MPKRKSSRAAAATVRRSSSSRNDSGVNFSFFNSKMFLTLVAVAVLVIAMAIFSSVNNTSPQPVTNNDAGYRIDSSTIQNDSSAQNYRPE